MLSYANLDLSVVPLGMLALSRLTGVLAVGPPLGDQMFPMRARALLAVSLTLLVLPTARAQGAPAIDNIWQLTLLMASELLVGLALGVGLLAIFAGVQLAGQLVSSASGMTLAEAINPEFEVNVPLTSQMLHLLATALFFVMNGHHLVLDGLLETFAVIPLGAGRVADNVVETLTTLASQSLSLGLRAAAPTLGALLLATLVMGLVSRALPQLNVLAFGFGINAFVLLGVMSLTLGGTAWLMHDQLEAWIGPLLENITTATAGDSLY